MGLGQVIKVDFTFKKLKGREETTIDKQWYEEFAGRLLYPHAKDVWVDEIPIPAPQSSTSVVEVYSDLVLTRDITVNYNKAWLACMSQNNLDTRLKNFIPPRYDQSYTARIFEDNGDEIPTAHPSNWVFDYENGILFFENNPADFGIVLPIHLKAYRYKGKTLDEVLDGTSGDASKVIIEATAGEDLEAYKVVYFKGDNKVYLASKTNDEILDSVVGITENSANIDENVNVILTGKVINANWNLEPLKNYFLGVDGDITNLVPTSNEILLKLGTAEDNNTIIFEPKIAIRRS